MATHLLVRRNFYCDSVALMTLSRSLTALPGVEDAAAVMSTEMNQTLLRQAGLLPEDTAGAEIGGPNDLLIIVRASSEEAADAALQAAESGLQARRSSETGTQAQQRPISLEQAIRRQPALNLAFISVPGAYAAIEARQALLDGLHVLLFSDNVSLEQEIALKTLANERGLLLMGPDCGTAIINGVGLGFANVVPRGSIGLVSASGTGLQQVTCLIAEYGSGVSQALGTGGRDLTQAVGGRTMLAGLELLQQDPATQVIVLLSKPPAPEVARRVIERAAQGAKPTVIAFLGAEPGAADTRGAAQLHFAGTLSEAARLAVQLAGGQAPQPGEAMPDGVRRAIQQARTALKPGQRFVRGIFSGGTLCDEAMAELCASLGPIYSNIPLRPDWRLPDAKVSQQHTAIDFGSDEFTVGRPHPMIDAGLRLRRLAQEAADPATAVILLDIVLGFGAHADPASEFAPAIERAKAAAAEDGRSLVCIVSLCGTAQDPQGLAEQRAALARAGALVFAENAQAARVAAAIVSEQQGA
ncbi:MAG TPA: acyl-CoA synthetase FdrA [Ktedonobacterales bacterium]|nr:acyl-CoA synthetase FdrA [Ktedonobacterales bacterium]